MSKWLCRPAVAAAPYLLLIDIENISETLGLSMRNIYQDCGCDYNINDEDISVIDKGDYFEIYVNGEPSHKYGPCDSRAIKLRQI